MSSRAFKVCALWAVLPQLFLLGALAWGHGDKHEPPLADTLAVAPATRDSTNALIRSGYERLQPVFRRACFDCHSNQTQFPWYHSLPIIGSWMSGHLSEARKHLDFSNGFPFGGHASQADNLYSLKEEVLSGAMPLWQYRLMHWGAAPNDVEKDSIAAWVDRGLIMLATHGEYPFNNSENVPAVR
jgi:hypothetical protein